MTILREIETSTKEQAKTWKNQLDARKWVIEKAIAAGATVDKILPLARQFENYILGRGTNEGG